VDRTVAASPSAIRPSEETCPLGEQEATGSHYSTLDELLAASTVMFMQTVIQTPTFLADAKAAGLDDAEPAEIAATIAANPLIGDIIPGTGGARKVRSEAGERASPTAIGS